MSLVMPNLPEALYLTTNSTLQAFDRPLLQYLDKQRAIAQWQYYQTPDEPSSLEMALGALHNDLKLCNRSIHLIGHGISGLLGLLYTQRYPEQVRSLTLLSVGADPAVDWQAHYYTQRQQLSWDRQRILQQMVQMLFGSSSELMTDALLKILEQDLGNSLSPHSLLNVLCLEPISVPQPLLVCGSVDDVIIDPHQLRSWRSDWSQESTTQLWVCPGGRYFFHYFYPRQTGDEVLHFWHRVEQSCVVSFSSLQPV
jgi:pimeloyl-ACP methyl ester carboxylesterase